MTTESPLAAWAWCFSHGTMHTFWWYRKPWCTASWVLMAAATEADAQAEKVARFGGAQFVHHLPLEQQAEVMDLWSVRVEEDNT